jgi:hypothetical protein
MLQKEVIIRAKLLKGKPTRVTISFRRFKKTEIDELLNQLRFEAIGIQQKIDEWYSPKPKVKPKLKNVKAPTEDKIEKPIRGDLIADKDSGY